MHSLNLQVCYNIIAKIELNYLVYYKGMKDQPIFSTPKIHVSKPSNFANDKIQTLHRPNGAIYKG